MINFALGKRNQATTDAFIEGFAGCPRTEASLSDHEGWLTPLPKRHFYDAWAALCLQFAYYNFCLVHKTLWVTPAMEAGIADRIWSLSELLS